MTDSNRSKIGGWLRMNSSVNRSEAKVEVDLYRINRLWHRYLSTKA
ncbi:hypothetical protein [Chamaesiphon minutus]|nr:hypothetical protein [Chamaesiphon minutus]